MKKTRGKKCNLCMDEKLKIIEFKEGNFKFKINLNRDGICQVILHWTRHYCYSCSTCGAHTVLTIYVSNVTCHITLHKQMYEDISYKITFVDKNANKILFSAIALE